MEDNKPDKGRFRFLAPLVLGNMLNPLNSTMLATAILAIVLAFHRNAGDGALLIVPLYFTSAIGQPLMGRLSDIFNPARINIMGFVIVLISGIVGVTAVSFSWLVVSRILLGLGSSAAYPSSITLIRRRYDALKIPVPSMTLAIVATAVQVSIAFGPFIGGLLLEGFGWKGIFFINIPLTIIGLLLSIKKKRNANSQKTANNKSINQVLKELDITGVFLFSCFLILLLIILLYSSYQYIKIPAMIIFLILFIAVELKQQNPFINLRILSVNVFLNTTFLRQIGITFILYMIMYGLPQWMEQSKGIRPSRVGLLMLPLPVMATIMSLMFSKSKNYIMLLTIGILGIICTSAAIFFVGKDSPIFMITVIMVLIGASNGILGIANQATLYAESPSSQTGVSFGLFRTVGYIGAILAGSSLKYQFQHGANDAGFHLVGLYALIGSVMIVVFMLPLYFMKKLK